jgi:beta-galactosidase
VAAAGAIAVSLAAVTAVPGVAAARQGASPDHALAQVAAGQPGTAQRPRVPFSADPLIAGEMGHRNTVSYDGRSFMINGRRVFLWSGEFHYFRLPSPSLWRDVLQKMKAAGFNAVSIYFDWAYHSPRPGVYDFSGVRNVGELLDIAEQAGLYVIARPGPYINAEVDAGGLPGWALTLPGHSRSSNPAYLSGALAWLHRIDQILARHQVTNGTGTVLLDQVENEYCFSSSGQNLDPAYMQALENQARADGITVPLFTNVCYPSGAPWDSGPGKVDVSAWDAYPNGFSCAKPGHWNAIPDYSGARVMTPGTEPLYMAEFQGGSFDPWGGPGYANCRRMDDGAFERIIAEDAIAGGFTGVNFYMEYGGTTWGWRTDTLTSGYSSYDYGAAITESRQLARKYYDTKSLGYFTQSVAPLADTQPEAPPPSANPAEVGIDARVNPTTGTQFFVVHHVDRSSTATASTTFTLKDSDGTFKVPSAPGTAITLAGRDSKLLIADYNMAGQHLVYSTSELMTQALMGDRDVAVLYGRRGQPGETVLRYAAKPAVRVLAGKVAASWDPRRSVLRLNYTHGPLARVDIRGGGRPRLLLLIGDDAAVRYIWRTVTSRGPLLVSGPELTRTAAYQGSTLALTGDTVRPTALEVFAPPTVHLVAWNGAAVPVARTPSGSLAARLPGPAPVTLPALATWKMRAGAPETAPGFPDRTWTVADHMTTNNPTPPVTLPVLYADDYGFHQGDIWYRGHFTATGHETGISLTGDTGSDGVYAVWLNGIYLGDSGNGAATFAFPSGALKPGASNVVAVLVENMGHNEDSSLPDGLEKQPRGLAGASLPGSHARLTWRIQGDAGGEHPVDPVRGLANTGGLYGERHGWYLPGYPDRHWRTVTLPHRAPQAGITWYRTQARLNVPQDQDVSVGLAITDSPHRDYRTLIYVNGWLIGRYINNLGPEHTFPIPGGIVRTRGDNTIALAVWNLGHGNGGIGHVGLTVLGNALSSLRVANVNSPGWVAPDGCTMAAASRARNTRMAAAANQHTISRSSPASARPGGGRKTPVSAKTVVISPAGVKVRSASRTGNSVPPTAVTSQCTGS